MTAPSEDIPVTTAGCAETAHGTPRLAVENLRIVMTPRRGRPDADVVDEISFTVQPGHVLGLVGESGSGKTTVALALLGLFKRGLKLGGGKVLVDGQDILALPEHDLQKLRGRTIAYVPQDPGSALNPVLKVGTQLREVFSHPRRRPGPADRTCWPRPVLRTRPPYWPRTRINCPAASSSGSPWPWRSPAGRG